MQSGSRLAAIAALVVALSNGLGSIAVAQQGPVFILQDGTATKTENKQEEAPKAAAKQEEPPKRDQKAVDYEKAIKDLKRIDGPLPMYQRKKDILLELDESQIGKQFYLQVTMATGFSSNLQAGDPLNWMANDVYSFERKEDSVWLVRPNLKFRWEADNPLTIASQRSMPKAILSDYRIEQSNPETKKLLINITSMFAGDLQNLGMMVSLLGGAQFNLDRDKSGPEAVYSNNGMSVVRMSQHYRSSFNPMAMMENPLLAMLGGNNLEDSRSLPLKVNYTLWFRDEKSTYVPRIADPRVGYFTADFFNMDRFYKSDRTERYINRWNVQKKDPKAAVSDPVKPIVWVIDPSIPEKWRPAVREGVLRWNRAFEPLGLKNVVQVVDAPKNDPNYDHADGTRNVIRFTMTEDAGYAVALFRTDPFTGEILNASVTVDANFTSFVNEEFLRQGIPSTSAIAKGVDLAREALTTKNLGGPTPREFMLDTYKYRMMRSPAIQKTGWNSTMCDIGSKHACSAAIHYRVAQSSGLGMSAEEYVSGYMADVVAHEVGHCLGLRHNFVASTTLTTAELGDPAAVSSYGVAASVMDYTPTNIVALLNRQKGSLWNQSVGPYDVFAIEYGYADVAGKTPEGQRFGLNQIARKSGVKGNAYMTDEDADSFNPYVVRFDSGKDPLNYMLKENESYRRVRRWAISNLPRNGESYAERTSLIMGTASRQLFGTLGASMFIGGVVTNRQHKGDVNEMPGLMPVDAATQRAAMAIIARDGLSITALDIPDSVLNTMRMDFNDGSGSSFTGPFRNLVIGLQSMMLGELMSTSKANAILENEFKSRGKDAYTLGEHYSSVVGAVFSTSDMSGGAISPIRRELQSFCVDALITQGKAPAFSVSATQRQIAESCLEKLAGRLRAAKSSDAATSDHLAALRSKISRYFNRQPVEVN